jgi:hypothetical protein
MEGRLTNNNFKEFRRERRSCPNQNTVSEIACGGWEKRKETCQESLCSDQDSHPEPPEYKSSALPLHQPVLYSLKGFKEDV